MRRLLLGIAAVVTLAAAGCAGTDDKMMMERKASLYDRLGGKPAITAVVEDFVGNVAADGRINQRFQGTDIPRLKGMLVDQICEATGGPCTYTGRSMAAAHRGMSITGAEFGALVEDLVRSLDKLKVPAPEKNELLSALGGMKGQIVGQ
jgi:hemoglobin